MLGTSNPISKSSDPPLGEKLFSFAVIADTHLNQGEEECNSPFEVNRLANGRMRFVVQDLNMREIAFAINLGDLVHPVPAIPHLYDAAANRFHEQVSDLVHDIHLVPGNHDVGDKPIVWGPAATVSEEFLGLWKEYFGESFYSFDHGETHFIVLNAQIINTGLAAEAEQRTWLEGDLVANRRKRLFVNIHYPPYLTHPDEDEHYDNIAEPGRSWLLGLLEAYGVEALFAGHIHNFWYHRHGATDCYLLPSTAFVRQDYSEMFRAPPPPGAEAGRNDAPKLGYFLVHVHEHGHTCEIVRTYGRLAAPEAPPPPPPQRIEPLHPRANWRAPLGFDMRQDWMETVQIPPSGGLDEFDRKAVRNDYPLMALWEMGIRKLRIPMRDVADVHTLERIRALRKHGHEFVLYSFGPVPEHHRETARRCGALIDAWEIGCAWSDLDAVLDSVGNVRNELDVPVYLSRLRSKEDMEGSGETYYHVINHGFSTADVASIAELSSRNDDTRAVDGVVFRVAGDIAPWRAVIDAATAAADCGLGASVHLRLSTANPADATRDDLWSANRIAEALAAALTQTNATVFVDTFADVDRGYFVRNGVVDRRFNPRPAFHVIRHLYGALNADDESLRPIAEGGIPGGRFVSFAGKTAMHVLVMPDRALESVALPRPQPVNSKAGAIRWSDLLSGEVSDAVYSSNNDGITTIADHPSTNGPILLTFV